MSVPDRYIDPPDSDEPHDEENDLCQCKSCSEFRMAEKEEGGPMSIMRCEIHNRRWDSDKQEECPLCVAEELDAYSADANREMGLPEDADFGDK